MKASSPSVAVTITMVSLVMLGLIGEYLGRMFLTVNQRPQSVVREVIRSERDKLKAER